MLAMEGQPGRLTSPPAEPDAPMDDVNPFRGIFGSEDSGQTNDGPLVEGQALIRSRVFESW